MRVFRSGVVIARSILVVVLVGLVAVGTAAIYLRSHPDTSTTLPGGASTETNASPAPIAAAIDLAPVEPAAPPDGECMRYVTGYDGVPMTVERSASISTSVVVGTVEEVGPARWRTAGEEPPAERWEMTGDNVMRLLRIKVDEELAGAALDGTVVTWIPGGTIGCHVFQFGAYPVELKTGERFTFFLDTRRAPLEGIADVARVVEMWPVEGDDATSPTEGKVALSEVSARADPEVVEAP